MQLRRLKQTPPRPLRRLAGRLVVGLLALAGANGAMVSHAGMPDAAGGAEPGLYQVEMQLNANGMAAAPRLLVKAGVPFAVEKGDGTTTWRGEFVMSRVDEQNVFLKSVIKHNGRVTGSPSLQTALGQPATLKVKFDETADELRMQLTVTQAAAKAP